MVENRHLRLMIGLLLFAMGCKEKVEETSTPTSAQSNPSQPIETSERKAPAAPDALRRIFHWNKEVRQSFDMVLDSTLFGVDGAAMVKLDVTSQVNLVPMERKSSEELLFVSLVNPEISIDGDSAPTKEQLDRLRLEMSQPVWGRYRNGKLMKVYLPSKPSAHAVGVWRTLLSSIQASMPLGGEEQFETSEFDGNGEYQVSYQKTGPGKWMKTKLSYLKGLHSADSEAPVQSSPAPRLVSSKGELAVSDSVLTEVRFTEVIEVPLSGASLLKGETTFSLTHKESGKVPFDTKLLPPQTALVLNADEPFVHDLPIDAMDKERIKGLTFENTLKALIARSRDPRKKALWAAKNDVAADAKEKQNAEQWTEDWARYFAALPAFFRQQPETLKKAEKEIRNDNPAAASLLGGLSSSGSEAAQEVLARLATDEKLERALRENAVRNLVQCTLPSKKTAETVWKLANDETLSQYAVFGIGIIARKLRKQGETDEASRLLKLLLERLEQAKDPYDKRDILRGISNTGDPAALPAIQPLFASENATIRGGAVEAVRLMEIPDADTLIAERISHKTEPAAGVRTSAIRAASNRSHEDPILAALLKAAVDDPEKKVKKEARKLLFDWSRNSPELTAKLEAIAAADEAAAETEKEDATDKM